MTLFALSISFSDLYFATNLATAVPRPKSTAKIVVKESLQEINDSRNFYNGLLESVQKLGKGLNERVEPIVEDAILDADKTALPKVDLLPKEKEGWEPGD